MAACRVARVAGGVAVVRPRAGLAMPLTMIGIAVPAHFLAGLDWPTVLLVGAILSPTDPVFAAAMVGRDDVPLPLWRLLNVESQTAAWSTGYVCRC